jgi:dolichol-phosphate mannosyltransferase
MDPIQQKGTGGANAGGPLEVKAESHNKANGTVRRHFYDIDGLIRVDSEVRLPELVFFGVTEIPDADLVIRVSAVGGMRPRGSVELHTDWGRLVYREHLGAFFANFQIEMRDPVRVDVGLLLALSPHVLYTNVIEPLLRFLLVLRGKMLLHAACVSLGGVTVMLSAKTDTGKTSTILDLLRQDHGLFLSDDMTIVGKDGVASRFPKPLTISSHTLHAVTQNRLRLGQRAALAIQSRLHSRAGRSAGKRLGASNLPIMSMNAMVQAAIPPPKYMVTDLVTCSIGKHVAMQLLYVIERGAAFEETISADGLLAELLENTDDAYGFPPYASMAPHLVLGGESHQELRRREHEILGQALEKVTATRLRIANYGWAERIRADVASYHQTGPTTPVAGEAAPAAVFTAC